MASRLDFSQIRSLYVGTSSSTQVGTDNLVVAGNVGIGTTAPQGILHAESASANLNLIASSANATFRIANSATSASRKEFTAVLDVTNNRVDFQAIQQGVAYLPLTLNAAGGNVLIGTTTDNGYKLAVSGSAYIGLELIANSYFSSYTTDGLFNANARFSGIVTPNGNTRIRFGYFDQGGGQYWGRIGFLANTNWNIGTAAGGESFQIGIGNDSSAALLINNASNVGIGTTNPTEKLDVAGNGKLQGNLYLTAADPYIESSGSGALRIKHTDGQTMYIRPDQTGSVVFFEGASGQTVYLNTATPSVNSTQNSSSTLTFEARARNAGGTLNIKSTSLQNTVYDIASNLSRFSITGQNVLYLDGNVGVGTNTPLSRLHTKGEIRIEDATDTTTRDYILKTETTGALSFTDSVSGERMRIDYTGKVGINTTAPSGLLGLGVQTSVQSTNGITLGSGENNIELVHSVFGNGFGSKFYSVDSGSGVTSLRIAGRGNSTSWSDLVTILVTDSASTRGNVGIGTTSPAYKLDVNGVGNFSNGFSGPSSETGYRLKFYDNGGTHNDAGIGLDGSAVGGEVMWFNALGGFYFGLGTGGTKVTISNTGNVGIGATSPGYKLTLAAASATDADILLAGMTGVSNGFTVRRVSSSFVYSMIDGNLGIGTTAPASILQVVGDSVQSQGTLNVNNTKSAGGAALPAAKFRNANGNHSYGIVSEFVIGNGAGTDRPSVLFYSELEAKSWQVGITTTSSGWGTNGDFAIGYRASNTPSAFNTWPTAYFTITSAGNVGIGTTAPQKLLHINGGSGNVDNLVLESAYVSSGVGVAMQFNRSGGVLSRIRGIEEGAWNGGLLFEVRNGAASNPGYDGATNIAMKIATNGNVGIGTTAPVNKLQVTSATNAVEVLRVDNTAGNSGSVQGITHLGLNFFGVGNNSGARITSYQEGVSGYRGGMYFSTRGVNSDSAPTEAMRITPDQLIGLGPVSSFTTTHRVWIDRGSSTYAVYSQGSIQVNAGAIGVGVTPSATIGRIDAANDIVAYSTSDERFKENITPIANALDKVKTLTGVEFDWRKETKDYHGYVGHDVGVIAQQVKAVLPEAVRTNANGYLAVRYEKIIGLLVEAMKEQQNQIDELKAKLDGLTK